MVLDTGEGRGRLSADVARLRGLTIQTWRRLRGGWREYGG